MVASALVVNRDHLRMELGHVPSRREVASRQWQRVGGALARGARGTATPSPPQAHAVSDPGADLGSGTVATGSRVAWLDLADRGQDAVYASALPDGPPVVLSATAALIFLVAARGGSLDEVVAGVAEESGQPVEEIRDDVVSFVDELVGLRLLIRG